MIGNFFITDEFLGTKKIYDYNPNFELSKFKLYLNQNLLKNIIYVENLSLENIIEEDSELSEIKGELDIKNNIYLKFKASEEDKIPFIELVITYIKNLKVLAIFCNKSIESLSSSSIDFIAEIIDHIEICIEEDDEFEFEFEDDSIDSEKGDDVVDETDAFDNIIGGAEKIKEDIIYPTSEKELEKDDECEEPMGVEPVKEDEENYIPPIEMTPEEDCLNEEPVQEEEPVIEEPQEEIVPEAELSPTVDDLEYIEVNGITPPQPEQDQFLGRVDGDELIIERPTETEQDSPVEEPAPEVEAKTVETDAGFQEEPKQEEEIVEEVPGEYVNSFVADLIQDVDGLGAQVVKIWDAGKDDVLNGNLYFTPIIEDGKQSFLVEDIENGEFTKISLNDSNSLELFKINKDEFAKLYQLRKDV